MKQKKFFMITTIFLLSFLLVACGGVDTPEPTAEPTPEPAVEPTAAPTEEPTEDTSELEAEATMADLTALVEHPWQWTSFTNPVEQFDVEGPENYVLTFNEDGTVSVKADCNNAAGSYTADGSSLTIEIGPMTMAACPEGSRSDQFVQLLGGAAIYFFEGGNLFIDLMADGGTLSFSPASAPETGAAEEVSPFDSGIIWRWSAFTDPVNGETVIDESETYTFSLVDGSAILGTGCRVAVGSYEIDGSSVTLTYDIPEITDESCPEGPNADRYFKLLQGAANYFTEDGRLFIDLMADGGTLAFDVLSEINLDESAEFEMTTAVDLCGETAFELNEIETSLDSEIRGQLDAALLSYVDGQLSLPAPGVSLLVITPEGRYFKSIGVADVDSCEPLPADASFEIGSNTKMMTSAMIYQLQEEGVLSTSDPISQWVPEMAAIIPNAEQITIDMLLAHTSGIYDYINGTADNGPLYAGAYDKDVLTQAYTPEELVDLAVEAGEPYFEPGTEGQWMYSNTGYILLGMIIEAATGKTYEENLQERIFEPLELEDTFLVNGQPEPSLLPQGYVQTPFDYTTGEWNLSQGWSAGAVVSKAEDMAVFLKTLFSGELFQDPATLDLMLAPSAPGFWSEDYYYGHGMFYKNGLLGHGGQALGYQSDVGYFPDEDVTIVIWGNSAENGLGSAAVDVAQAIGLIEIEE
jgi:D-alanyl-D-alanine carboxypeptidase